MVAEASMDAKRSAYCYTPVLTCTMDIEKTSLYYGENYGSKEIKAYHKEALSAQWA